MILKSIRLLSVFMFSLALFSTLSASGQNKVVVVPLMEEGTLEPYAPLASVSPPTSSYSLGTNIIIDNVTGLVWQQMDDNDLKTWHEAWDYCQNLTVGSKTDWRLPSVAELMSIVDYSTDNPAINSVVFPDTKISSYWSATRYAGNSANAVFIGFREGTFSDISTSSTYYVRCVRGLPARDSIFVTNGNGTVTDLATGRIWQREDDNIERTQTDAVSYCQGLSLGGKNDWRLPNIKELHSIIDLRVTNPAIDADVFPNINPSYYWSATQYGSGSSLAWYADFYNGLGGTTGSSADGYVLCVR